MKYFTNKEMANHAKLTSRTVLFYTEEGLLIPEIENPRGRGKTRKYSKKNLAELFLIKALSGSGFTLKQVKKIFNIMNKKDLINRIDPVDNWGMTEGKDARLWLYRTPDDEFDVYVESLKSYRIKTDIDYITLTVVNLESIFVDIDEL